MSASSAVTINRPVEAVRAAVRGADAPVFDETYEVSFAPAPGDRGTELRVATDKSPAGGVVAEKIAAVIGTDPQRELDDMLRRLKQVLETGEVIRSDGSPDGTDATRQRRQRPAQAQQTDTETT